MTAEDDPATAFAAAGRRRDSWLCIAGAVGALGVGVALICLLDVSGELRNDRIIADAAHDPKQRSGAVWLVVIGLGAIAASFMLAWRAFQIRRGD